MKRGFQSYDEQSGDRSGAYGEAQPYGKSSRFAKSLCVSNIGAQYTDDVLVNELQTTFQPFGDVQVKIAGYMGRRVAYLNFFDEKAANDAYDRFLSKTLPLFDRSVHIEPVRSNRPRPPRDSNEKPNDRYIQPKPPGPNIRRETSENKSYRYAHHLDRTLPEDDQNATRTLFVGNLDPAITKEEIIKAFSMYGVVLDVDIKYSGQNSSGRVSQNPVCFAFLRFKTVDEAYAAKLGMSGQMLLTHTCKIGYGKIVPSACLWVGNIASTTTATEVEGEFRKFGLIQRFKLETNHGNGYHFAIVLYDTNDSAANAASKMRAFRFPKTNRRLRVDFIGPDEFDQYSGSTDTPIEQLEDVKMEASESVEGKLEKEPSLLTAIKQAATLTDLFSALPRIWSGTFLVKSSLFLVDLHVLAGDGEIAASHMANSTAQLIKVSQRVSISDNHIDELRKRCQLAHSGYCVLLANSSTDTAFVSRARKTTNPQLTIRPLRAFSLYLQSKSTMGVFMLQSSPFPTSVVLCYVLPSCPFVEQLLTKHCLAFDRENCSKDDYLMLICFRSPPLHA